MDVETRRKGALQVEHSADSENQFSFSILTRCCCSHKFHARKHMRLVCTCVCVCVCV